MLDLFPQKEEKVREPSHSFERWLVHMGLGAVPSTDRDYKEYHLMLFPDLSSPEDVVNFLENKTVLDLASGWTHTNPESLMNVTLTRNKNTKFFGVDPCLDPKTHTVWAKIKKLQILRAFGVVFFSLFNDKEGTYYNPGEHMVVAGRGEKLPIKRGLADVVLCSFLIGYWLIKPVEVAPILKEMKLILKPEGQIRVYPI